jgi:hypothetical protein
MQNVNRRTILMTPLAGAISTVGKRTMPIKISQLLTPSTPPVAPRPERLPRRLPLQASDIITLSSAGAGTASVGPSSPNEVWEDMTVSVRCATNIAEATCRITAGSDSSIRNFVSATTWGSTGAANPSTPPNLRSGQTITATWTGGDANTTAYLIVTGHKRIA